MVEKPERYAPRSMTTLLLLGKSGLVDDGSRAPRRAAQSD
jgi:hypothetical protein